MIASVVALGVLTCVPGETARTPVETVDAFVAAYNGRDLSAAQAVLAPGARILTGAATLSGSDLIASYGADVFRVEPAYQLRPLQQMTAGDMVAQMEAFTGGPNGAFTGLTVYRVDGGCIVEMSVNR